MRRRLKQGMIERARSLRTNKPDAEGLLWWKLREANRHGYHFRRQVPVRGFYLDFAEHSAKLGIELDGGQHGTDANRERDISRDAAIARDGYSVLRFENADVMRNLDGVVETILLEVTKRRPPTRNLHSQISTSPRGGGH